MMEAALVLDKDWNIIHRHLPPGRSAVSLPDTRGLWDVLWENRRSRLHVAHSHPGTGFPVASHQRVGVPSGRT